MKMKMKMMRKRILTTLSLVTPRSGDTRNLKAEP